MLYFVTCYHKQLVEDEFVFDRLVTIPAIKKKEGWVDLGGTPLTWNDLEARASKIVPCNIQKQVEDDWWKDQCQAERVEFSY